MDIHNNDALKRIWDSIPEENTVESGRAFSRFWRTVRRERPAYFGKAARIYSYIAAALFIPMLIVGTLYLFRERTYIPEYAEFIVPQGQRDSVRLEDNSLVWLNAGSRLIYPKDFSPDVRKVFLIGEGFFEVAKDPERPFVVSAGEVSVRVLGTKFNLSSYEDSKSVYVSLVEGSVRIESEHNGVRKELLMSPGEIVQYDRISGDLGKTPGSASAMACWKNGGFYFNDRPLDEIVECFERAYGVRITLDGGLIDREKYSLAFVNDETLDQMLSAIAYNGRLTVVRTEEGYSLRKRK